MRDVQRAATLESRDRGDRLAQDGQLRNTRVYAIVP
jgi:hypothetical protein